MVARPYLIKAQNTSLYEENQEYDEGNQEYEESDTKEYQRVLKWEKYYQLWVGNQDNWDQKTRENKTQQNINQENNQGGSLTTAHNYQEYEITIKNLEGDDENNSNTGDQDYIEVEASMNLEDKPNNYSCQPQPIICYQRNWAHDN